MTHTLADVNVSQSFQNLLDTVVHAIPKVLVFLVILVVGWIIARVLMQAVVMLLRKVKFDKFVERGVVGEALGRTSWDAATLIGKIVYYMLLLVTLQMAFGVFGTNPISTMLNSVVGWLPKAIVAIILVVIGSAIAKVVKDLINGAVGGLSYGPFLASVASIIIIALFAIAALNQVGIAADVTGPIMLTVFATAGAILAIGIGGGLVRPMQSRWERMLTGLENETTRQSAAYQQGRRHAMQSPASAPADQVSTPVGPASGGPVSGGPVSGGPAAGGPAAGGPAASGPAAGGSGLGSSPQMPQRPQ